MTSVAGRPAPSSVKVDTPELRELKAEAGIEDCEPGPGGGALPAVTLACLGGGPTVDLSSLRGPMVHQLLAVRCVQCEEEMPILQAFHEAVRRPGGRAGRRLDRPVPRHGAWSSCASAA